MYVSNWTILSKILLTLGYVILCLSETSGQENIQSKDNKSVEIGLSINPNYSLSLAIPFTSGEPGIFAYDLGVYGRIGFTNRLSARIGVSYVRTGFSFGTISLRDSNGRSIGNYEAKTIFEYINFPLILQYSMGNGKFKPIIELGLNNNIFFAEKFNTENGYIKKDISDAQRHQIGVHTGKSLLKKGF